MMRAGLWRVCANWLSLSTPLGGLGPMIAPHIYPIFPISTHHPQIIIEINSPNNWALN